MKLNDLCVIEVDLICLIASNAIEVIFPCTTTDCNEFEMFNDTPNDMYIFMLVQSDIRKNPIFRQQFHEMCAKVGVDPLASKGVFGTTLLPFF
jgi:hypothetical protein